MPDPKHADLPADIDAIIALLAERLQAARNQENSMFAGMPTPNTDRAAETLLKALQEARETTKTKINSSPILDQWYKDVIDIMTTTPTLKQIEYEETVNATDGLLSARTSRADEEVGE